MDTLEKDYDCDFKVMMVESTWLQHNLNEAPQLCVLKKASSFLLRWKNIKLLESKTTTRKNEFDIKMVSRKCKSNLKLPAQSPAQPVCILKNPLSFHLILWSVLSSWFILPYLPDGGNIFQLLSAHKVSFLYPEPRIHPCILWRHITHYTSRPR